METLIRGRPPNSSDAVWSETMTETILFEESVAKDILETFSKTVDDEGFVVEVSNPSQRVLTPEGEEVKLGEFAGISNGSLVFIKNDLISLIGFSKKT